MEAARVWREVKTINPGYSAQHALEKRALAAEKLATGKNVVQILKEDGAALPNTGAASQPAGAASQPH